MGVSLADACRDLEVSEKTVRGWLTRGRSEADGAYHDFAVAVDEAREVARAQVPPMDEDELRSVVARSARKGSVQAMKLYWEMIRAPNRDADADAKKGDPFEALDAGDELAQIRARRGAAS